MKVLVTISKTLTEEKISVEAREMTPALEDIIEQAERLGQPDKLTVKKEEQLYRLHLNDILRFNIENRKVLAWTARDCYTVPLRLYQVKDLLDQRFLQISQSEIVQISMIAHLTLLSNGLIEMTLKNGDKTFSSRRYLQSIKERLELYKNK